MQVDVNGPDYISKQSVSLFFKHPLPDDGTPPEQVTVAVVPEGKGPTLIPSVKEM
jgi:hypothetical protein